MSSSNTQQAQQVQQAQQTRQMLTGASGKAGRSWRDAAGTALSAAVRLWFAVAVAGQLLFAYYVAAFYGGAAAQGNPARWNEVAPHGYVAGETVGNAAFGFHVLAAVVITVGGALQLLPQVRRLAPVFHRWNGRVYVLLAVLSSLIGLYMVWGRGTVGGLMQHVGVSVNAVLILLCAFQAVRHARARDLAAHRRWALRLFLVVSGVWFFRVGLMFWLMVNQAPVGFDPKSFEGPFLSFLSFAQFLFPLAVLELYLRARDGGGAPARAAMAAGLLALTAAMGAGIFAAALMMWLPRF